MGIVRDLYYARKMSAGLKLPAPTVALLIKRLRLAAAMGGGGIEKTVSGTMVHITDALAKAALSVLVNITPIQDLHGYANPWPGGGGKNLVDMSSVTREYFIRAGNVSADSPLGTPTYNASWSCSDYIAVEPSTQYTQTLPGYNVAGAAGLVFFSGKSVASAISGVPTTTQGSATYTFTTPSNCHYVRISWQTSNEGSGSYPYPQLEKGAKTSYAPYSNICPISGLTGLSVYVSPTQDPDDATVYNVDWSTQAGTVYGGTVDVVTGVLTATMANIASYNGESINEPWLSSMDAYAPGATPTTGAQVVYTLATPLTYQLTPQEIQMLLGENYVWSSSGDTVSVTYYAEGNANPLQSLNILLGGRYSNPKTADDVSDKEALEIILGGNK